MRYVPAYPPGTAVILALALTAELERRDALDQAFIARWTEGFDQYMAEARKYSLQDVEQKCRITAQQFYALADLFETADNIAIPVSNGIERGHSGDSGVRAAMALAALTGNHGRPGAG